MAGSTRSCCGSIRSAANHAAGWRPSCARSPTPTSKLRTETGALVTALRKPNARGQWGQMQLRNVVELAGMLQHCDFAEQSQLAGGETVLRPDLIVNMPGGKHVVVDAKAPLQGVLDAYQARDEEERQRHLRDHAQAAAQARQGARRQGLLGRARFSA